MANHISAKKRIRQSAKKRLANRFYAKSTRNALKEIRNLTDKEAAAEQFPKVVSMLDKLVKRNQIHKNKAANLKSQLAKKVNSL